MSDIDDYTYSPYDDDLEDILWDADPAPELADDLAEHALHSPVYLDEVAGYELEDYFSDWEYYSDDYMDDDPALLRRDPQVGPPSKNPAPKAEKNNSKGKNTRRGKKRKVADTLDIPPLDLGETELLTNCIRGTVWANPSKREPPSYKAGQEGTVALMKNWKELFANTDDGWGRKSGEMGEDESWAKDMSLADMGLQNVQRQSSFERGADQADAEGGDEEEVEDELEDPDELEVVAEHESITAPRADDDPLPLAAEDPPDAFVEDAGGGRTFKKSPSKLSAEYVISTDVPQRQTDDELPPKRRRIQPNMSRLSKPEESEPGDPSAASNVAPLANGAGSQKNRKRKATDEQSIEEPGPSQSTAGSRSKRIASSNSRQIPNVMTTSRATRNSKQK